MSSANKDVIYIDLDDEITSVIDKVQAAKAKIVALVLPKRATVFQSIVNMKLLKRAAMDSKKSVVLITSEAALLPLAGAVSMHVAKTLQSKPAIPPAPVMAKGLDQDAEILPDEDVELDPRQPVGELAEATEEDEAIEIDNSDDKPEEAAAASPKKPFNKKLKIPNFNKFRLRLVLGGVALVLVLVLWYFAAFVMPKARIVVKTDTSTVGVQLKFTADPKATEVDKEEMVLPAKLSEFNKTDSEKVQASGQKNMGEKAKGTMNLTNCINDAQSHTVPAGTSFSSGNFTFVSTEEVVLAPAVYSGNNCRSADFNLDKDVPVVAANGGESYNLSARSYTASITGIRAAGSAMTGGTTKLVKVVSQADLDSAKSKIEERASSDVKSELANQLETEGYIGLTDTLNKGNDKVTSSPKVDEEGEEVTVTVVTTYTMLGVKKEDLSQLVKAEAEKKIDTAQEAILEDGLDQATIGLSEKKPSGQNVIAVDALAESGPQLDEDNLKKAVAGKKKGEAQNLIQTRAGVQEVNITLSPFWVHSVPKQTGKITLVIESANDGDD